MLCYAVLNIFIDFFHATQFSVEIFIYVTQKPNETVNSDLIKASWAEKVNQIFQHNLAKFVCEPPYHRWPSQVTVEDLIGNPHSI